MTVIASLITSLGLDSTAFTTGLNDARKRLKETQKSFSAVGNALQGIGAGLTVGVTAPIVAIGGAMAETARGMADGMVEITKAAQLANTTSEEFQRLSFAAKSVGFEGDKLADVYKDVNDRVGEFLSTGGGEMKDFFENVAPKVGLTAEAFRGLSGPKALQLYYDSLKKAGLNQQQMTFYMEAMADEASALIPLLQNGGAAMAEMGGKAAVITPEAAAEMKRYVEAQREMGEAWKRLTIAVVSSGLMDTITDLTITIAGMVSEFAKSSPELFRWTVTVGGVAAALGPVIAAVGTLVSGLGALLPVLAALRTAMMVQAIPAMAAFVPVLLPVLAPLAAVSGAIALVVAAVRHWDEIKAVAGRVVGYMGAMVEGVSSWLGQKLGAVLEAVRAKVKAVGDWFFQLYDRVVGHSYVPDMVDEIGQNMRRLDAELVAPARAATSATAQAFAALRQRVGGILQTLFPEQAKINDLERQLSDLDQALASKLINRQVWGEARDRLAAELEKAQAAAVAATGRSVGDAIQLPASEAAIDPNQIAKDTEAAWARVKAANDNARASWAETARDIASTLGGLARQIKSGDWLDALGTALDLFAQIKGGFGSKAPAARTFPIAGARAMGGPVLPNRNYVVGERGPEILRMGRQGGQVIANDQIGAPMVVQLVVGEGQMFEPRVASISGGVSVETVSAGNRAAALRGRQQLGGR